VWIFAYGSLIFRPAFEHVERRRAFVRGYVRRFWQASPDHRGTETAPGRVATLVEAEGGICGGAAYRILREHAPAIMAALDHREKAGFTQRTLPLLAHPEAEPFAHGVTWVADRTNPWFREEASEQVIAAVVRTRVGPSGENVAYVHELRAALRALEIEDPHVETLADAL
jgi:glutathione-specific gamma-glutamylcyclotransferase